MVQRRKIFDTVKNAVDNNADVCLSLKSECCGNLSIPVGDSDRVAMDILEFLGREHGELSIGQMEDAIRAAEWWLTTTAIL